MRDERRVRTLYPDNCFLGEMMMPKSRFVTFVITQVVVLIIQIRTESTTDPKDVRNWIVKDICVDKLNKPIQFDSYYTCPDGTTRRKIFPTDPLPFNNIDQVFQQQSDSFPLYDTSRNFLFISTFDWYPFNRFNLFSGSDGFDVYSVTSKYLGIQGTRDGGGYGQQFFGCSCQAGTGWITFPVDGFLNGGGANSSIHINYWEQSAQSYPGPCPASYSTTSTYWEYKSTVTFGGVNGNPIKIMDAMISYHGNCASGECNMEVFWFTREYGRTMWQAWRPEGTASPCTGVCIAQGNVVFKGYRYVISDCHDWSAVKLWSNPEILQWPIPAANLLMHSHFDSAGGYMDTCGSTNYYQWCRTSSQSVSSSTYINLSVLVSTYFYYPSYGTHQINYIATNCAESCNPTTKFIYQDLPISSIVNGGSYLYGIDARCEGSNCNGTIQVNLQIFDSGNNIIYQDCSEYENVLNDNGDGRSDEVNSVYASSAFYSNVALVKWTAGNANKIRFQIAPVSIDTFNILDAFLNPFPTVSV